MLGALKFEAETAKRSSRVGAATLIFFLTCAIVYLATQVWHEMRVVTGARSDVVQWSLAQAEVEHRTFMIESLHASVQPEGSLEEVRKRFDVIYSRVETLDKGQLYAEFRADPQFMKYMHRIKSYLEDIVGFIDSSDEVLIQNLPQIVQGGTAIYPDIRAITLYGVNHFARLHTEQRQVLLLTLTCIAVLTGGLLVISLFMIRALDRLNQQNRHRAWLNDISRARLSAIVSTSLDAIVVTRNDSRITEFNGAAEGIFEYKPDEVIGTSILSMIELPGVKPSETMCMQSFLQTCAKKTEGRERIRVQGRRKSGDVFPAELSIGTVEGTEGLVYVSYIRDISKEANAENELRKARDSAIAGEKSKASLLAVMSHEMRTPLNGMLGTIELLGDSKLLPPQREYLRIIRQSGELLLSHVNDVLDISRLDAGKLDLDETTFELGTLIQDLIDGQAALAKDRGNKLSVSFDTDQAVMVRSDHLRLRQILLNLIGNANKFTENGEITVEVETSDTSPMVEIRVIDTGIGIASSEIEHIFADFTTLDATYGRRAGGTGLGLAIARRVARAMHGNITAESVRGEGSMFTLQLPILAEMGPQQNAIEPAALDEDNQPILSPVVFEKLRILVVEDNEINRIVAHDFLVLDNHDVSVAEDGASGLSLAKEQKFDVILMDISMPDLDGTEVTKLIKSGDGPNKDTPIFALTAHAMEEDIKRFKDAGMKRAIIKPITRNVLRQALFDVACGPSAKKKKRDLLDIDALSEFREELGESRFQMLFSRFTEEMDQSLEVLEKEQPDALAKRAHKMGGSASMFGALRICCALRQLEKAANAEEQEEIERTTELVKEVWSETVQAFDAHLAKTSDMAETQRETMLADQ